MTIKELMQDITPSEDFEGFVTNDDWVLAVGIGEVSSEDDYTVVQVGVSGVDPQLNPATEDKNYLRVGSSTQKTSTQRSFAITGDRYIGDKFQDYCCTLKIAHGVGQAVVVPYAYFCLLTGRGEKGVASIIVNSDGGGEAGASSAVSIDLKSTGAKPSDYVYKPAETV